MLTIDCSTDGKGHYLVDAGRGVGVLVAVPGIGLDVLSRGLMVGDGFIWRVAEGVALDECSVGRQGFDDSGSLNCLVLK